MSAEVITLRPNPSTRPPVFVGIDLGREPSVGAVSIPAPDGKGWTSRVIDDRGELIAAFLLAVETEYLAPVLCYPSRGGHHVLVMVGAQPYRLTPDDCRTAARALIDEQAFAGFLGVAADLREAAAIAEADPVRPSLFHAAPRSRADAFTALAMAAIALILAAANSVGGPF